MSRSTFSGPVQVGIDDAPFSESTFDTLYTPPVSKIGPNWGFVNMVQSAPIVQSGSNLYPNSSSMTMVIPAKSVITRISVLVTTAWGNPMDIGQVWGTPGSGEDFDELVQDLVLSSIGLVVVGPGDTDNLSAGDINNWMNNSMKESPTDGDRCIVTKTNAGGTLGVGVLTVEYCQAVDLSAIA